MSSEIDIKALVLNRILMYEGERNLSLVFNEMSLAGKERRLDLGYLLKDRLVAIEIKSEKDTLSRLTGQLAEYRKYFDKIVLVVAKKFTASALLLTTTDIELWEVDNGCIKIVRKGRLIKDINKCSYLDLMTRREIELVARELKLSVSGLPVYELKQAVLNRVGRISKERIKNVLLDGFHKRFGLASARFMKVARAKGVVAPQDVPLLSPHIAIVSTEMS